MIGKPVRAWGRPLVLAMACAAGGCLPASPKGAALDTSGTVMVEIVHGTVSVDGEQLASADALPAALNRHVRGAPTLVVRAPSREDEQLVVRVLHASAPLRLSSVRLRVAELDIGLLGSVRVKNVASPFVIVARFGATDGKLWSVGTSDGSLTDLETIKVGDSASEAALASRLKGLCPAQTCEGWVTIGSDAPVIDTLLAWQRVARDVAAHVVLSEFAGDAKSGPTQGTTAVAGWLPPETIQSIVRAHFGRFRTCYEQGLARDPKLEGKVAARFIIGREGKVTHVSDGGSSIPDAQVRDCVLKAFLGLTFPRPQGGIVTVVYPIMLAPG